MYSLARMVSRNDETAAPEHVALHGVGHVEADRPINIVAVTACHADAAEL